MARADSYLTLPPWYAKVAGGLQWSHRCDAVEFEDGSVVALADEVGEVLAGAFGGDRPPHFAHLLSAYHRLKAGGDGFDPASAAIHAVRLVPGACRNAGRLIAHLLRGLPPVPDAPTSAEVELARHRLMQEGERRRPHLAVEPSLSVDQLDRHLRHALAPLSADVLAHWLKFGGPPTPAGPPLADPVESLPAWVAKALATGRDRLAGAARLVPLLDAALTLPPRRRRADAVPQGGYADVTTRGQPDQLLPSQLALDPDEFVRRFAERELLFFQREEPHTPKPAGRLVVLDQGVRTWGLVRHGLAAAAAVLLGKDPKRAGVARLAATSVGPVDLDAITAAELAHRLAASDLSAHPADVLRQALADATGGPRDVVLLTHPRSAADPVVLAATTGRGPDDRVFALTLDDAGAAELVEWRPGGMVRVRVFRVDLAESPVAAAPVARADANDWTGDREDIGFPFRPGLVGEIALCGLDAAGDHLVAVSREGVPQVLTVGDAPPEVLPRTCRSGVVLRQVEAVLGVAGGVVLCGRMSLPEPAWFVTIQPSDRPAVAHATDTPSPPTERLVAAHYDFVARTVRLHDMGTMGGATRWEAFPDLHCISARRRDDPAVGSALNLDSGVRASGSVNPEASREATAWRRLDGTPAELDVMRSSASGYSCDRSRLVVRGSTLRVLTVSDDWVEPFTPTRDGQPLLDESSIGISRAVVAGDVLAVQRGEKGFGEQLHLFRGPTGTSIRTLSLGGGRGRGRFTLSADGRRLGVYDGTTSTLKLLDTDDAGGTRASAHRAKLHPGLEVRVSTGGLTVRVGGFLHTFLLRPNIFHHELDPAPAARPTAPTGVSAGYDPGRFRRVDEAGLLGLLVWADQLGQVVLATPGGIPKVAVLVRRDKAAAWAAGGVYWGEPALLGGPPTPDAAKRIAAALTEADR